jgi:hypothetical protein
MSVPPPPPHCCHPHWFINNSNTPPLQAREKSHCHTHMMDTTMGSGNFNVHGRQALGHIKGFLQGNGVLPTYGGVDVDFVTQVGSLRVQT